MANTKVLLIMGKPLKYTKVVTLKITPEQDATLKKLKSYNVKVSNFIREAIGEKLIREKHEIIKNDIKKDCPF